MRIYILASLLALAACDVADQKAEAAAETGDLKLGAGQWETTAEITNVISQDDGAPVLKAGKIVTSNCVTEADAEKPAPAVLSGSKDCTYKDLYMRRGRITASISCPANGRGNILIGAEGQYKADSFEATAQVQTYLSGKGDAKASSKVTGRRVGACIAPAA